MSEVFEVDPARPEDAAEAIEAASAALTKGGLVVFPTETVYGVGARPDVAGATTRLFEAKHRPAHLTLPVLVPVAQAAWRYGERTEASAALATAYWPGPITLVLRRTRASAGWLLGEADRSIGLRVPDHEIALALLRRTGAMATTSANLSGHGPVGDPDALRATFGDAVAVYLMLSAGVRPPGGTSSTVVDLTSDAVTLLRPGPITLDDVRRTVPRPRP